MTTNLIPLLSSVALLSATICPYVHAQAPGPQASGNQVAFRPVVRIDDGAKGKAVADNRLTLSGTATLPANASIIVNHRLASIDPDGNWFVDGVPLESGSNSIAVTAMTIDFEPIVSNITVVSTADAPFDLTANATEGVAPFDAKFVLRQRRTTPFQKADVAFDDKFSTLSSLKDGTATLEYQAIKPGIHRVSIKVFDTQGRIIYEAARGILVHAPERLNRLVVDEFQAAMRRLESGDVDGALRYFTATGRANFQGTFVAQRAQLPSMVEKLGTIGAVTVSDSSAEIELNRATPGGPRVYPVQLLRGRDGLWRIDAM